MKPINFLDPVPPKIQEEFYRWYRTSVIGMLFLLVVISSIQIRQWYLSNRLCREKKTLQRIAEIIQQGFCKQNHVYEEKQGIIKRLSYINEKMNTCKRMIAFTKTFNTLATKDVVIDTLIFDKKYFEATCIFSSIEAVITSTDRLSELFPDMTVKMLQLKKSDAMISAVIKGTLKKNKCMEKSKKQKKDGESV